MPIFCVLIFELSKNVQKDTKLNQNKNKVFFSESVVGTFCATIQMKSEFNQKVQQMGDI